MSGGKEAALHGPSPPSLPSVLSLSSSVQIFLNAHFQTASDLASLPTLLAKLRADRDEANQESRMLRLTVLDRAAKGASYSQNLAISLHNLALKIEQIRDSRRPAVSMQDWTSADANSVITCTNHSHLSDADPSVVSRSRDSISSEIDSPSSSSNLSTGSRLIPGVSAPNPNVGLVEELSSLAKEVAKVEQVRIYAENVLRLERLVGDLEDAVTATALTSRDRRLTARPSVEAIAETLDKLLEAVRTLQSIEDLVAEITTTRPQWKRLILAVDLRVDRAAAALRPTAIADHRSLLAIVGWPPPLAPTEGDEFQKDAHMANPLLAMGSYLESRYQDSFVVLSTLQAVQRCRRKRQKSESKHERETFLFEGNADRGLPHEPLWTVQELVGPIASRAEHHFVKWTQKPELVCALAYRICQEYVDMVDEYLQPMLDKARLAGYSVREEWVACLVTMVGNHLKTHVLPGLANDVQEEVGPSGPAAALWLHTVDQILAFDTRMRSLAVRALGLFQMGSEGDAINQESIGDLLGPWVACIGVFAQRSKWLEVWADAEFEDSWEKLQAELEQEKAWVVKGDVGANPYALAALGLSDEGLQIPGQLRTQHLAPIGEFRAPVSANLMLAAMYGLVDRCRTLPEAEQRLVFVREGVAPIAKEYLGELLRRCQEAEGLTALAEESEMVKVAVCVNAAWFCEGSLQEWGEDIFFLELRLLQSRTESEESFEEANIAAGRPGFPVVEGSIFDEEIGQFAQFRRDWIHKLVSVIARGFEARCREYFWNKKRWLEEGPGSTQAGQECYTAEAGDQSANGDSPEVEEVGISPSLLDALALLQGQLQALHATFDEVNFMELWRDLAVGLDHLLLNSIVLSGAKFSNDGGRQFAADIRALFQVFKPFCVRPASFFKGLSDSVQLLTMPPAEALTLQQGLSAPPRKQKGTTQERLDSIQVATDQLRQHGVRKITPVLAEKILSFRVFPKL